MLPVLKVCKIFPDSNSYGCSRCKQRGISQASSDKLAPYAFYRDMQAVMLLSLTLDSSRANTP